MSFQIMTSLFQNIVMRLMNMETNKKDWEKIIEDIKPMIGMLIEDKIDLSFKYGVIQSIDPDEKRLWARWSRTKNGAIKAYKEETYESLCYGIYNPENWLEDYNIIEYEIKNGDE
jgi:hypothetical protein